MKNNIFFRQKSHFAYLLQITTTLILILSACGEGYHSGNAVVSSQKGAAALTIQWHEESDLENANLTTQAATMDCQAGGVDYVVCEVYDEAGNNLATGGPWPCGSGSGEIDNIPTGANRTFVALAEDTDGNIRYHGQSSGIAILADQYTEDIFIDAYPFIPNLSFPTEGQEVDPNGFTFTWQPLGNANQYIVQVAQDMAFETILIDDTAQDTTYVPTTLSPSMQYYWKVFAVDQFTNLGAASETRSFITSDCTYTISLTDNSFGPEGGSGEFSVGSSSFDCNWVAVASDDWISVISDVSSNGAGFVRYTVAANPLSSERAGTIMVGGQVHAVTQQGAECSYTISPANASFTFQGGEGAIDVTATADDCPWEASTNAAWITIVGGNSRQGNGSVAYQVAVNSSGAQRQGTITVNGQPHTIVQEEQTVDCAAQTRITSISNTFDSNAGSANFGVQAPDGCSWSASANQNWIHITSGASGSGDGTIIYRVDANTTATARRGTISVGTRTHTITQQGIAVDCAAQTRITSISNSFDSSAGNASFGVRAPAGCTWNAAANQNWIHITSGASGSGDGTVAYRVDANTTATARRGTISVGTRTHTITQQGVAVDCAAQTRITSISNSFDSSAGTGSFGVRAPDSCTWSAQANQSWIHITSAVSGSGDGTIAYRVDANTANTIRRGTITVGERTHTITQQAPSIVDCEAETLINSTSATFDYGGGTGGFQITAPASCQWSAVADYSWINITTSNSGSGSSALSYSVAANNTGEQRRGTVVVNSTLVHQVVQNAEPVVECDIQISPQESGTFDSMAQEGTLQGTFQVMTEESCDWNASSNNDWIHITSGQIGSGNGTVVYTVDDQTGSHSDSRTGTIMVNDIHYTVHQNGHVSDEDDSDISDGTETYTEVELD